MSREASEYYTESLDKFERAVLEAIRISQLAAGRHVERPQVWWASVLFTRLCTSSVSLLNPVPGSRFFRSPINHYDSSAAFALARNILECYLLFFYLCVDAVSEDEWKTRLNILYLNDCVSRIRMFRDFNPDDPQLPLFEEQAEELRQRLTQIRFFNTLPANRRRVLLKANRLCCYRGRSSWLSWASTANRFGVCTLPIIARPLLAAGIHEDGRRKSRARSG